MMQSTRDVARSNYPVFFFHKHSILTWMFNRKIENCHESGLISHWIAEFMDERKRNKNKEPKKLGIANIMVMIQITGIMYMIASIVFILEVLSRANEHIQNIIDYLTY